MSSASDSVKCTETADHPGWSGKGTAFIFSLSADPAHGNGKYGTYFLYIWLTTINGAGTHCSYPDMLYKPLDPAMRLWLLKSYYQYMLHTPHSCICVKENFVQLPKHISIVCSSNVHNGIAFWNNTSHGLQYYILKESGFSQKLYEFCQFLENGNMAWSQEETLDII